MIKPIKQIKDVFVSKQARKTKLQKVKSKFDPPNMKTLREILRRLRQPSGRAALTVIVMIAGFFGVQANAEVLGEMLTQILQGIIATITGIASIYEMFRDEDKKKDE